MSAARTYLRFWLPALVALAALVFAATAQADYGQVGNFAKEGNGEQLENNGTDGIAVNSTGAGGVEAGSVYVSAGNRVSRYNAKGEIKEVWGWNTIASGPDLPNQVNTLKVSATSGTYEIEARTAFGAAQFTEGSKVVDVWIEGGAYHVGDAVVGNSYLPAGTTITAIGPGTVETSAAATGTTDTTGPAYLAAAETTAPIPYNASATEVQEALLALPAFGAGDISVTGIPGDYEITFEGAYGGTPVGLDATESTLAGGVPSSGAAFSTSIDPAEPRFERCRPDDGDTCVSQWFVRGHTGEEVGSFSSLREIAIDQSTGYVYVLSGGNLVHTHHLIEVFSADGSESIARFGDLQEEGDTIETSPGKLTEPRSIAVSEGGRVYVGVAAVPGYPESRVTCFRPEAPNDYEHYVYCGRSQDVKAPAGGVENLAVDDDGHLYLSNGVVIQELSLAEPANPALLCTYNPGGAARGMTTNPLTGEVFYFNSANSDRRVHRLKQCDAEGKFVEAQAPVGVSPPPGTNLRALAINPALSWGPNRPAGVLYGAANGFHEIGDVKSAGLGYIFAPAEVHSPAIESESVSNTRTTSTILHAAINPHGFATHYVFQYLSEAQYEANEPTERFAGAAEAPAGGGAIGGGSVGQANISISGLEPDTTYRFRVVATSECNQESGEPCVVEGEALSFATYPLFPPGLPDHRAYELVSPAQKHGGEVIPAEPEVGSCGSECKPNVFGKIFPIQSSPNGEALVYEGQPFDPLEGAINYDSYVSRRTTSGWQTTALIPALPPGGVEQLAFDGGLDRGLLAVGGSQLETQNTSDPSSTTPLITETDHRSAGELRLSYGGHSADFSRQFFAANDSLTDSTPFSPEPPDPGASKNDLYEWHEGQLAVVNVLPGNATVTAGAKFASISPDTHAVSEDGSKVFFKDEAGNLYVRIDGEETKQVDDPGHFLSASPSGGEVLLTDGCLYSLASESCSDLTEGKGGFQGLVGQSTDLSHIYFVDTEALGGGEANEAGEVAEAGKDNLYSWSGGEAAFVARLSVSDNAGQSSFNFGNNDWDPNSAHRSAEASPSGRFLAFASVASLTGYDNAGLSEAFLYDSATGKLVCASCNPTGEAPLGPSALRRINGSPERFPQPRYLTDEARLYFDTQDSLSARDTNEGVEDVYEYSPRGTGAEGTCEREGGCIRLISAGTESVDSNLIAVDETGKNVFFDTRDKLALKDKDELLDIYDAREGGGIAAESEIARAECQGENCQAPVSPPNDPTPASSSFEGAGNVKEAPAAKKHAKKKKHPKKHKKAKKHARTAKRNHGGAK